MTFNGSWGKLKTDPAAKFMVLALVFYLAATFEGSLMAIKSVNSLSHYTDWNIAHVHSGAIGWVAMITIGSLYAMAPRALDRPAMHSRSAMELHFWLHTAGLLLYVISMWAAGATAGLMWRATNPDGSLTHSFLASLIAIKPFYVIRFIGGAARAGRHGGDGVESLAHGRARAPEPDQADHRADPGTDSRAGAAAGTAAAAGARVTIMEQKSRPLERIEQHAGVLGVLIAIMVSFGGLAEIVPLFVRAHAIEPPPGVKPYDALRLAGKDIYVREACYQCHSQMIRTLRFETQRYGAVSEASESVYDRPFQWGSKRTGPDLARIGGKYSDAWQRLHLIAPRELVPESNMPNYPWLEKARDRRRGHSGAHANAAPARRSLQRMRKSPRRPTRSEARPSSMRSSPTCRDSAFAMSALPARRRHRHESGVGSRDRRDHRAADADLHRHLDLGVAAVSQEDLRGAGAPSAAR